MKKVSVIIPVYNVEKYVEECLRSVMNQTLKDIEIICIEDAGADSSKDIIKRLMAIREKNLRKKKKFFRNQGAPPLSN